MEVENEAELEGEGENEGVGEVEIESEAEPEQEAHEHELETEHVESEGERESEAEREEEDGERRMESEEREAESEDEGYGQRVVTSKRRDVVESGSEESEGNYYSRNRYNEADHDNEEEDADHTIKPRYKNFSNVHFVCIVLILEGFKFSLNPLASFVWLLD